MSKTPVKCETAFVSEEVLCHQKFMQGSGKAINQENQANNSQATTDKVHLENSTNQNFLEAVLEKKTNRLEQQRCELLCLPEKCRINHTTSPFRQ